MICEPPARTPKSRTPEHADGLPELVPLPPGNFAMGSGNDDKFATETERPRHPVRISYDFSIGCYPVTVREYRAFDPWYQEGSRDDLPAINVSWIDAVAYCAWLTEMTGKHHRLPSEAEWEYACRAGSTTPFAGGSDLGLTAANFLYSESGERIGPGTLLPVGSYPPNAFGLHDLHGNVCEWVADIWHPSYQSAPADGSAWLSDGTNRYAGDEPRVIRGGAWDHLPRLLRSAWRDALPPTTRRDNVGFRIARTLSR